MIVIMQLLRLCVSMQGVKDVKCKVLVLDFSKITLQNTQANMTRLSPIQ